MTAFLLWVFTGLLAALVGARALARLVTHGPLRKRNYRGLEIPSTAGIAALLGLLAGITLLAVLHILFPSSGTFADAVGVGTIAVTAAIGFGFLGLWDDVAGTSDERGWRAHVSAVFHGRATPGAIKLVGGGALALIIAAAMESGFWWTLADAAIIALGANAVNLLDKRPGRASKTFLLASAGLMIVGGGMAPSLAAGIGACLCTLPYDLRERAMLGDAGANGLGALLGVAAVFDSTHGFRLLALGFLVVLGLLGERPGISRIVDASGPLRRLDRIGRV
ncbi:MAG: hypothetical protein ACXVQ6_07310 [Actinomycetota bacterium]